MQRLNASHSLSLEPKCLSQNGYGDINPDILSGDQAASVYDAVNEVLANYNYTLQAFGISRPPCEEKPTDCRSLAQRELDAELPSPESRKEAQAICDSLVLNTEQQEVFQVLAECLGADNAT